MTLAPLWHRARRATTMVELLVVIVIFLVGILAIVQVFPRGLQIVANTGKRSVAIQLARREIDQLRANTDRLPEQVIPVGYVWGTPIVIQADPNRAPGDLGPVNSRLAGSGQILDAGGNALGPWQYLSGANVTRRVIGEGGPIPAPRQVGGSVGGLMVLQFAPIVFNPTYQSLFQVYGNDLIRRGGTPGFRIRDWEYFVENADDPTATIYVLRDPVKARSYRLAMNAWINNGINAFRREIVDTTISVPAGAAGYVGFPLASFAGLTGPETFEGCDFGSVRLARSFDQVVGPFSGDPYEFQMVDDTLGLILFNPAGYNYMIPQPGGRRIPLTARVNYDVYDWRIIREEFRISAEYPAEQRLALNNLMHANSLEADGRLHTGLNVQVSDEAGGTENRDFILLDLASGGIYSKDSLKIDYSGGRVRLIDSDANPANGVQVGLVLPGAAAPTTVTAEGRAVRALYQATGEWSVQVMKPASAYRQVYARPGNANYYTGGANQYYFGAPLVPGESLTRIYFPPMDAGKKVTIGKVYYDTGAPGEPKVMESQDFLITNSPPDTVMNLPYIDITSKDPTATNINFTRYGFGVSDVRGASVSVRVLWNPGTFTLSTNEAENLESFERWGRSWVRFEETTFLTKEVTP